MLRSAGLPGRRVLAVCIAIVAVAGPAQAKPWWLRGAAGAGRDFLPPGVAFRVSARIVGRRVAIRWDIAHGYYLYRSKMQVAAASPDLIVGRLHLPPGVHLTDRYFGAQEVYYRRVEASVPFTRLDFGAHPLQIKLTYQGCATAGLCYPPIVEVIFPDAYPAAGAAPSPSTASAMWEWLAIAAGMLAFLVAGLVGRRARQSPRPDP
ncbi:MAG TPA: protein-disulfide reductase DsbD N-terminal domain-containing protein [Steroidobacteraceae bacterium]|nr:protein-disulfide reductase DsbD N-terminal domain-containing protein [Steroidobacteraceae bacterium]